MIYMLRRCRLQSPEPMADGARGAGVKPRGARPFTAKAAWGHGPLRGSGTVAVREHSAVAPLFALAEFRRGTAFFVRHHPYMFRIIAEKYFRKFLFIFWLVVTSPPLLLLAWLIHSHEKSLNHCYRGFGFLLGWLGYWEVCGLVWQRGVICLKRSAYSLTR